MISTLLFDTTVSIPVPPAKFSESSRRETVSVPVSPEIERSVEILTVFATVICPCSLIVRTGIEVEEPYVLATTPVSSRENVTLLFPTTEDIPVPPARVRTSDSSIMLSAPVSPAMSRFDADVTALIASSTYIFVTASVFAVGAARFVILEPSTSIEPDPFGLRTRLPFVSVVEIAFPLIVTLSTLRMSILLFESVMIALLAVSVPGE